MDIKALEVMACPFCQGTLSLLKPTEDQAGEGEGQLRCGACDEAFPIHSGIPRMVVPRHTYQTDIASSFGREWQLQADGYFEEHEIYGGSAEAELQDFLRYFGITESTTWQRKEWQRWCRGIVRRDRIQYDGTV